MFQQCFIFIFKAFKPEGAVVKDMIFGLPAGIGIS